MLRRAVAVAPDATPLPIDGRRALRRQSPNPYFAGRVDAGAIPVNAKAWLGLAALGVVVPGCLFPHAAPPGPPVTSEEASPAPPTGPLLGASFWYPLTLRYEPDQIRFTVVVTNHGGPGTVTTCGTLEETTSEAWVDRPLPAPNYGQTGVPDPTPRPQQGNGPCFSASLVPGERASFALNFGAKRPGTFAFRVSNDSVVTQVRPLPRLGEWVNSTRLSASLLTAYRNSSTDWQLTFQINSNWTEPITLKASFEGFAQNNPTYDSVSPGENRTISLRTTGPDTDSLNPFESVISLEPAVAGFSLDYQERRFRWCCF